MFSIIALRKGRFRKRFRIIFKVEGGKTDKYYIFIVGYVYELYKKKLLFVFFNVKNEVIFLWNFKYDGLFEDDSEKKD